MALFKVFRGDETNLPASMNDGWAYFCTDTGNFYIDWANGENLVRTQINANYANKLQYRDDEELVEINPQDIATKSDIPQIDTTLTVEGATADAKAVGDALADKAKKSLIINADDAPTTGSNSVSGIPIFTIDYTPADLKAYADAGGSVTVVRYNRHYAMYDATEETAKFRFIEATDMQVDWYHAVLDVNKNMTITKTTHKSRMETTTGGAVGQIPVIKSLDSKGRPSAWEFGDMSAGIDIDATLTIEGAAADAKSVGDALIKNLVDGANGSVRGINTNTEIGTNAFAEGGNTKATGYTAHAEGDNTTSSAHATHSEGVSTVASNYAAHAEGQETTASGHASHAEGRGTKASSETQHVQGKWNVEDTNGKYAHIVGNGYSTENASNAHTVDWNGVGWFAGGLKVGGTGQDDSSAVEVALKSDIPDGIPNCTTSDDGKFLRVVGGVAAWVSISNAEEAIF